MIVLEDRVPLEALIDTGANVSCIELAYVERARIPLVGSNSKRIKGIGGKEEIVGEAEFTFRLKENHYVYRFTVVEHLPGMGMILGRDFLGDKGGIVDFRKQQLTLYGEETKSDILIPLKLSEKPRLKPDGIAILNQNLRLPARTHVVSVLYIYSRF